MWKSWKKCEKPWTETQVSASLELNSLDIQITEEEKKSAAVIALITIGNTSIETALASSTKPSREEVAKANLSLTAKLLVT